MLRVDGPEEGEGASPFLTLDGFAGPLDHLLTLARAQKIDLIRIRLKKHPLTGSDRCDPRSVGNEPVPCIAAGANDLFV